MSDARSRWSPLGAALLASLLSRFAGAQVGEPCNGPEITLAVPAAEREKWLSLPVKLQEYLRPLSDLDRCAQLTLRSENQTLMLDVRTRDGRVASRPIENEAQLLRTSEALLTLPPRAPSAPLPSPLADEPPLEAPPPSPHPAASVELGAAAAARLGGLPLFIAGGVTGFADVAVTHWVLGVSARWDLTAGLLGEPTLMDYYLMSTAVGVHVGHRFDLKSAALDLLLGPNLVLETQHADDANQDIGGTASDVRIDLGVRLSGAPRSNFRAFCGVDLELSPARMAEQHFAHPHLPPLPSFSFGLALGGLWSLK